MIPKTDGVHIHNILPKSICDLDKALQWLIANTTITIRSQKDGLRTACNSSIPGRSVILSYILKEAYLNARDSDIVTDKLNSDQIFKEEIICKRITWQEDNKLNKRFPGQRILF